MKKILFVNDEMTIGGVSRILNTLLRHLEGKGYEIDLLVLNPRGEMMDEIPNYVNVLPSTTFFRIVDQPLDDLLQKKNIITLIKKSYFVFLMKSGLIKRKILCERKKILKKHYDIEFSAKEGFCTVFTAYGDSTKKLNWVQVDYKEHNYSKHYMPLLKDALTNIDLNLACSRQVCESYKEVFDIENVEVLHNLMDVERIKTLSLKKEPSVFKKEGVKLIAVARFHPQKSLDRLIHAVKYAKERGGKLQLVLIGGGILEEELKNLTLSLGCDDVICFKGYSSNPYPAIQEADCFVLSSLYEGYPTIVLESFLSGTPVLACDVAGVAEQILEPCHGWIIENSQTALNEAILYLCNNESLLHEYKAQLSNYQSENRQILERMEELFHEN